MVDIKGPKMSRMTLQSREFYLVALVILNTHTYSQDMDKDYTFHVVLISANSILTRFHRMQ